MEATSLEKIFVLQEEWDLDYNNVISASRISIFELYLQLSELLQKSLNFPEERKDEKKFRGYIVFQCAI